jgi:hypothetical protein
MSKKCRAYSESKLGLEPPNNRKAFYAGWDAALQAALAEPKPRNQCAETCERAKLCAVCLAEMTADREPVAEVAEVAQAYDGQWTAIVVTGDVELQPGTKLYTTPQPRRNVTYFCPACHFSLERQE